MSTNTPEFTVSELAQSLKHTVEQTYGHVRVRGELGRVTIAKSGHCYLDVKDDKAVINSIIWKGVASRLSMRPEEGMEVICEGKLSTYPGRSNYQLIIDKMELAGAGALMALFEKRKKMLAAEGLFDEDRKVELPFLPKTIGVVTSPTGSVIRDILHRITDRFPSHVLVWPVLVQGEKAAEQISEAIDGFNTMDGFPRPDVLIVARGGGSMEDLWCFNEENVARAAANSSIPLISAVGHETDWTLIDFVADYRAPTPTGAAEVAVPVRADWVETVEDYGLRLLRALRRTTSERGTALRAAKLPRIDSVLAPARQRLDSSRAALPPMSRLLEPKTNRLTRAGHALQSAMRFTKQRASTNVKRQRETLERYAKAAEMALKRQLETQSRRLDRAGKLLDAYSYQGVLDRGYALVRDEAGTVIRSKSMAASGQSVSLTFADGEVGAVINGKSAVKTKSKAKRKSASLKPDKKQADLF